MKKLSIFGAALALFIVAIPASAATDDYKNYWTFDDATGRSVADTKGGQNGVLTGSSTGLGWAGGKIGTALAMDGVSGEGVALPNGFLSGSQGSLSVWFRMEDLSDRNIVFSAKSVTDSNLFAALMVQYEGRPQFVFRTDPAGNNRLVQGSTILNKNEWYNLVFTANAQGYKMYVNGLPLTVTGDSIGRWFSDLTNQQLSYRIGTSEANPLIGSFNGYLDDMRIYDRALSDSEVTALYNEGNAGRPTVPLALRPTLSFSTTDGFVSPGGSATLTWSATKVDSCTASGGWTDAIGLSGTKTVTKLTSDQDFKITCTGKGGAIDSSVRIMVGTSTPTVPAGTLTVDTIVPSTPAASGGSTLVAPFMRNLTVGSSGDDVKNLQNLLIAKGFLAAGLNSGYFGGLTRAAVAKYQAANDLPATGFVGAMTRAKLGNNSGTAAPATPAAPAQTPAAGTPAVAGTDPKLAALMDLIAQLQAQLAAKKASGAQ